MNSDQDRALRQMADEIIECAYEVSSRRGRLSEARRALKLWPGHPEALLMVADCTKCEPEQHVALYAKAVEATRSEVDRYLPKGGDVIHWWLEEETRPYMHALQGLLRAQWAAGQCEEALGVCRQLLDMNPQDDQGIRYCLLHYAIALRKVDLVSETIADHFADDVSASAKYPLALWAFLLNGPSPDADHAMQQAIDSNRWVPAYLFAIRSTPSRPPDMMEMKGESEAIHYMAEFGFVWRLRFPELSRKPWDKPGLLPDVEYIVTPRDTVDRGLCRWIYDCLIGVRGLTLAP
ncbi:MAG: hypothetical protein KKI08_16250 [Armatimonadetes bacterium]|nr:hypothetical protein [Armatimonadota bacterium]